jgi:hypothetical protein
MIQIPPFNDPLREDANRHVQDELPRRSTSRRWWLLGCLSLLALLLCLGVCTGLVAFVFELLKSSEPYSESLRRAQAHPDVVAALGEPIEPGWLVTGEVRLNNDAGHARLSYTVSGPRGSAAIAVIAVKDRGLWEYQQMTATLPSGERIDLSE